MSVRSEISGNIGRIIFGDPKANSLSSQMLLALEVELRVMSTRPDVRVVGLESEGDGAFCGGASLDEVKGLSTQTLAEDFFLGFARVMLAIRDLPLFVVAKVQGRAVGGALGIIAAADSVVAANTADVRLSELSIGLGPFVVGPVLERKIGTAAFQHLTLDTGWKSAAWAEEKGLYAKVAGSAEFLQELYLNELLRLAAFAPAATAAVKKMFWEGTPELEPAFRARAKAVAELLLLK